MPRIKRKTAHIISIALFALFAFSLFFFSFWRVKPCLTRQIQVPIGSSTARIASILQEEGLIQSALLFRLVSKYKGYDGHFQAGHYQLNNGMTLEEILQELQKGTVKREGIRFTIPEGFTVMQIATRLEEEGIADKETFAELCRVYGECDPEANLPGQRISEIPSQVLFRLEGYLYPDTYEVFKDTTEEKIIELMLARFAEIFNEECLRQADKMGLSTHQIVTIASLVEKEATLPEERALISAVFHNRLKTTAEPLLQSCATIQYILGEAKPVLTNKDLAIDSPFNTYLYPNLPPGPIASPGWHALYAALYPADVDYLYFVSREDGSNRHYFSRTLQEHNAFKKIARQNRH
ncbi:MAG TPA: endolytic transglycosylase MltG [Firmicutes bacterium]|nr:endolytic transglycosylase MltG [Bacillota bacterium]